MKYEGHLFISYAHLDNQPLTPEQEGWVSRFHAALQNILTCRLGHHPRIWRDKKLSGNDAFSSEILQQLPKTEILVSILSNCYIESDWCRKEIEEFCRSGDVKVGNKLRIIKVLKLPVTTIDPLPPVIKDMDGYEFFVYQDPQERKRPLELDPIYFPQLRSFYFEKLYVIADDIVDLINKLEQPEQASSVTTEESDRPIVYLAQCGWDLKLAREALAMNLREHGCVILPDRQLPSEEADYVAEVSRLLEQSSFAILLVGGVPGFIPDGPGRKSALFWQNELAIAQARKTGLKRVIWIPEEIEPRDEAQKHFIASLHRDVEAQFGADLITGELEALKAAVRSAVLKPKQPAARAGQVEAENAQKLIYVICNQNDREAVLPIRRFLKEKGFEVRIPLFQGCAAAVDSAKQENLAQSTAALVFYGNGDEGWKHAVDSDLKKSRAYRGDKPPLLQFNYLSGPETAEKQEMIELEEPNVINGLNGFSETALSAFVVAAERV